MEEAYRRLRHALERVDPSWVGLFFFVAAVLVYLISNPRHTSANFYNHFEWQADAFLNGRFAIPYPVREGEFQNHYFQDVFPLEETPGWALIPFPPLPALLLMPVVAIQGMGADAGMFASMLGAFNVALAWRMLTRLTDQIAPALLGTIFYGFGTVAWYASMLGSTWFFAHVAASTFLLLAITMAFDGEREEAIKAALRRRGWMPSGDTSVVGEATDRLRESFAAVRSVIDPVQFMAGFLFGLAGMARLTVMFGAPFFVFVGGGGSFLRRAVSAGLGASIPMGLLLAYNLTSTGHIFHPAYEHLYQTEYVPQGGLKNLDWGIEDVRYIPHNARIMLAWPPKIGAPPECAAPSLLDTKCPIIRPDELGMSLPLTSPAYLLALPLLAVAWRRRVVLGAGLAVLAIALIDLMHFSQGWVQFGYRFSNDFAPFALVLVTLAIGWLSTRRGALALTLALVIASVVINAWGVYWGVARGW